MSNTVPCSSKKKGKKLGGGTFGEVYLFTNQKTNETTAIKVLKQESKKPVLEFDSLIEIDILFKIKSSALVSGIAIYGPKECSIFESVSLEMPHYGVITNLLYSNVLSLDNRIFMIYKLLLGVKCLHHNNILHLDIKPENTLYKSTSSNPDLVLADFGLSVYAGDIKKGVSTYRRIGTRDFRPPEWLGVARASDDKFEDLDEETNYLKNRVKINYIYNDKFDIWSVGISSIYILTAEKGKDLILPNYSLTYNELLDKYMDDFSPDNINTTLHDILNSIEVFNDNPYYDDLMELLTGILNRNPEQRFDIDQALRSEIFKSINLPQESKISRNLTGKRTPLPTTATKKISDYSYTCFNEANLDSRLYVKINPLTYESRYGLKYIFAIYNSIFGKYYVRDLFDSIDLYMRLVRSTESLNKYQYMSIGFLSIRMIYKYYYQNSNNFPNILEENPIPKMEIIAIKNLKGIIKEYSFYDLADSEGELNKYTELLLTNNMEAFNHYFMINMKQLKDKVLKEKSITDRSFKRSKVIISQKFLLNIDIEYEDT